jgi:hypothetical protein
MQKQQTLHCNAEPAALHDNAEAAGAILKCKSSRSYNIMQKQQVLPGNAKVAGAAR